MKFLPMGGELLHADGRTDMRKLIVAFRNFRITHKKFRIKLKFMHLMENVKIYRKAPYIIFFLFKQSRCLS
jgi:hypothetical protein